MSSPPLACFIGFAITLLCLDACTLRSKSGNMDDTVKFEQYYVQGKILYNTHCSNCHQQNGAGLRQIYPPLDTSDFMEKNFESTICLIKYGISGELTVNGKKYNQAMEGISTLTALEIAEIATYIYSRGHHDRGIIATETVKNILEKCR